MSPSIALFIYISIIAGLFWLDRNIGKTSIFLWLPVIWLMLASSRSVAQWLEMQTPLDSASQMLEGSPVDRAVYTGLLFAGLAVLFSRRNLVSQLLVRNSAILLFFIFCAISLTWSDFSDVAFKRWTKACGDLVMVLIVLTDPSPINAVKKLFARLSYVLIPVSILLIKYYPQIGKGYSRWEGRALYVGVATNKNTLGVICLFLGLAALWRFFSSYKDREPAKIRRMAASGIILLMVAWLFRMANSMTSVGCFVVAAGFLFALNTRMVARRPGMLHFLVVTVLVICGAILFLGVSPSALAAIGRNPTLTDRTEIWSLVLGMVQNPLLGTGFESFWLGPRLEKIWSIYGWGPSEAHNGYIEIYLNLGWIGIVLLSVVLISGYRAVVAAYRRNLPASTLFMSFFVVGMVYNCTEAAFFRMMAPAWIFMLLAMTKGTRTAFARSTQPAKMARPQFGSEIRTVTSI